MHHNVKATDKHKELHNLKNDPVHGPLLDMSAKEINTFIDKQDTAGQLALLKFLTRIVIFIAKRHLK